ncbi:hypothetical protein Tco_0685124 [Tanacetum coccineum]
MIMIRFRKFIRKHGTWKQDDRGKALLDEDDYEEFGDYLKEQIQWLSLHQQDSPKLGWPSSIDFFVCASNYGLSTKG